MASTAPEPPAAPRPYLPQHAVWQLAAEGHIPLALPPSLQEQITSLFAAADHFFDRSEASKLADYPPAPSGGLEHGFYQIAGEKQFLTFRHARSSTVPDADAESDTACAELEALLPRVWHEMAHLLYRLLADIGRELDVPDAAWDPIASSALTLPSNLASASQSMLRVFRYEPARGVSDPHCDLGLLTLCVCRGVGLEVWAPDWEQAPGSLAYATGVAQQDTPPPYVYRPAAPVTLLAGDTLHALSGARVKAGAHRVVPTERGRSSIVFALRPALDVTLDLSLFGGQGPVAMRDVWEAIRKGRVDVNAQPEIRAQQRLARQQIGEQAVSKGSKNPLYIFLCCLKSR